MQSGELERQHQVVFRVLGTAECSCGEWLAEADETGEIPVDEIQEAITRHWREIDEREIEGGIYSPSLKERV